MRRRITTALNDQTIRFVIAGGGAALLFYGLSVAFISAGARPFGGTVAAYAIAFVVSYTVQHHWTFGGQHRHSDSLPRYIAAQACCALAAGCAARAATSSGLPTMFVSLASTLLASAMSYGLSRYWVFASRD